MLAGIIEIERPLPDAAATEADKTLKKGVREGGMELGIIQLHK